MKRILSAIVAMAVTVSFINSKPVLGYVGANPWVTEFNTSGEVSKTNNSGTDRLVDSAVADPNNSSNYVGMMKSYNTFSTKADIGLYKSLSTSQSAFYSISSAMASAGSGVNKMDFYFTDTAVQRKTAPRFAYITTGGLFTITSNFNTFNLYFDTDGKIRQNYQASVTSTVDTTDGNRVVIGSYEAGHWYRMVQRLDTVKQIITIDVYDLTNETNAFSPVRFKDAEEVFESSPVASGIYYCGYGGLAGYSSSETGDAKSKGATVLGINGIYVTATVPAATASEFYIDNLVAAPTKATATLAVVDSSAGSENKATILDAGLVNPNDFIGKTIQLRLSQPIQNTTKVTSVKLKKVSTGEEITLNRNASFLSAKTIADATYPQIMEFNIPSDLEANTSYEFVLNGITDIHGQSFDNLTVNCLTTEFIASLEQTADELPTIVSDYNNGLDINAVTGNISLPTQTGDGFSIEWVSTTDADTLALDGAVTRPPYIEDGDSSKEVTLNAIVSKSGIKRTRSITFVVTMQEAVPEFYVLKSAFEESSANFAIEDGIITEPIAFPATCESSSYAGKPVTITYQVSGRNGTTDSQAQTALSIANGTSVVTRSAMKNGDAYANIQLTFRFPGAADRYMTVPVMIPHQNLLSGIGNSVLTDARPTTWEAKSGEEYILNLGKTIVIGKLFAVGEDKDNIAFYTATGSTWEEADNNFPLEASKIKVVLKGSGTLSIKEIEAYATDKDRAYIDITTTEIEDDLTDISAKSIDLPFVGTYGTQLVWTSSNESVIDKYGTVTKTASKETVTITVTPKDKSLTDETKSFTATVAKKTTASSGGGGGSGGGQSSVNVTVPYPVAPTGEQTETTTPRFDDMSKAAWAKPYVEYLADNGILNGRGNKTFAPNDNILREEFVKVVLLAFDIQAESKEFSFADVDQNQWYYDYIKTAAAAGIVKGNGNAFGIGEKITREDMAVILLRAAEFKGLKLQKKKSAPDFADLSSVREDAKNAMTRLAEANVLGGYEDSTIRPKNPATRAETAKLVYGVLESTNLLN